MCDIKKMCDTFYTQDSFGYILFLSKKKYVLTNYDSVWIVIDNTDKQWIPF